MIVCVCNNVSDRKIRQAVNAGVTSMSELRNQLGVASCCGKCHSCARQVLRSCLDATVAGDRPIMFQADNLRTERTKQHKKVAQVMAAPQSGCVVNSGFAFDPQTS